MKTTFRQLLSQEFILQYLTRVTRGKKLTKKLRRRDTRGRGMSVVKFTPPPNRVATDC